MSDERRFKMFNLMNNNLGGANSLSGGFGMGGGFGTGMGMGMDPGFGNPMGGFANPMGGFGNPMGGFANPMGGFGNPMGGMGQGFGMDPFAQMQSAMMSMMGMMMSLMSSGMMGSLMGGEGLNPMGSAGMNPMFGGGNGGGGNAPSNIGRNFLGGSAGHGGGGAGRAHKGNGPGRGAASGSGSRRGHANSANSTSATGDYVADAKGVEGMLKQAGSMVGLQEGRDRAKIQKLTGKSGINPATTPWCAAFAMNLIKDHGLDDLKGLSNRNYCPTIESWARGKGKYGEPGKYNPKPGDAILFDWQGGKGTPDHIGIVEKVKNGRVYTIEGNSSDSVKRNSYPLSSNVIDGYFITGKKKK